MELLTGRDPMKFVMVICLFIFCLVAHASRKVPYVKKYEDPSFGEQQELVIEDSEETTVVLSGCNVVTSKKKYLGTKLVCVQTGSCIRSENAKRAIVENSTTKVTFTCLPAQGETTCKSRDWGTCAVDTSLPDDLDQKCLSDTPGVIKPGCPSAESAGKKQPANKGLQ
jgi:hypothetical protein